MQLNQTAYLILGVLSLHPQQSGYHIRKTVESSVSYFWGESYGQIYPTLKRLAAQGLIAPSGPEGKKRSQEYSLTPAGHICLQEWLALPYREDPPRNEFLLKLFFGVEAAPGVAIVHLCAFQQKLRGLLATLTGLEKMATQYNTGQPGFPYWMLTLTYGLAQIRSALEWSESALTMLNSMETARAIQPAPVETLDTSGEEGTEINRTTKPLSS
jgi:DNA-binding PadR family transcriptional regulator